MRSILKRVYWSVLALVSLLIVYEAITRQIYGDNSFWLAVVFLGIAARCFVRIAST